MEGWQILQNNGFASKRPLRATGTGEQRLEPPPSLPYQPSPPPHQPSLRYQPTIPQTSIPHINPTSQLKRPSHINQPHTPYYPFLPFWTPTFWKFPSISTLPPSSHIRYLGWAKMSIPTPTKCLLSGEIMNIAVWYICEYLWKEKSKCCLCLCWLQHTSECLPVLNSRVQCLVIFYALHHHLFIIIIIVTTGYFQCWPNGWVGLMANSHVLKRTQAPLPDGVTNNHNAYKTNGFGNTLVRNPQTWLFPNICQTWKIAACVVSSETE